MSSYVFAATFHPNDDGSFTILFPDIPGCISEGKSLENALFMAQDALKTWIEYSLEHKKALPPATPLDGIKLEDGDFVNLIRTEVRDEGAVRRTVSIPRWMDEAASSASLSLSRVLQDALKEKLGIA